MDFYNHNFLIRHAQHILCFYDNNIIDKNGGYHQNFYDDGSTFDHGFKQLVSSTRIIVNYASAASLLGNPQ